MAGPWEKYQTTTAGPWQKFPQSGTVEAKPKSFWENALEPIKNLPGDIASEYRSGAKMASEGLSEAPKSLASSGTYINPIPALKMAGGVMRELASPITGAAKAIIGDPIRAQAPHNVAVQIMGDTAETLGSVFGPGLVSKVMSGAASYLPKLSDSVKLLMDEGVRLTPGHMGDEGVVGRAAKTVEDAFSSWPGFVKIGQQSMFEDFNRAALNRSLKVLGQEVPVTVKAGRPMIDYGQKIFRKEYSEILPKLKWDNWGPQLSNDVAALRQPNARLPEEWQKAFQGRIDDVVSRITQPNQKVAGGDLFKQIESELSADARGYKSAADDPGKVEYGRSLDRLNAVLRKSLEELNPTYAPFLRDLNEAYSLFKRVEGASIRRVTGQGADPGIFSPADLLREIKANTTENQFSSGRAPMQDLADAAQMVLPQTVPNSGTIDRAVWLSLLGGAGIEASNFPRAAAMTVGATLPYTKPGLTAINKTVQGVPRAASAANKAFGQMGPFAGIADQLNQQEQK